MSSSLNWSRKYPPDRLYEIGKKSYRGQKYEDALDAFTAAIAGCDKQSDRKLLIALLDIRAATSTRLGHYDAAIDDGSRLLKHDDKSVMAYLRIAKIFLETNRPDKALRVYRRGVDRGDRAHPRYLDLCTHFRRLNDRAKATDPVAVLPHELLESIFRSLPFTTICTCAKVSRLWRQSITSTSSLWQHIDLASAKLPIRRQDFEAMMRYAGGSLRQIFVKGLAIQANRTLELILVRNKQLESLTLLSGGLLEKSFIKALSTSHSLRCLRLGGKVSISAATATDVLRACPTLIDYELDGVVQTDRPPQLPAPTRNLQSLSINIRGDLERCHLGHFFHAEPSLRSLRLIVMNYSRRLALMPLILTSSELERLYAKGSLLLDAPGALLELPRQLRSLTMINSGIDDFPMDGHGISDVQKLAEWQENNGQPLLRHLNDLCIEEIHGKVTPRLVHELLYSGESFTDARLDRLVVGCAAWLAEDLEILLNNVRLRDVQQLQLGQCVAFGDKHAAMVAERFKGLRELRLPQAALSGVGVKALVLGLPKLQLLGLAGCWTVGRDAVDWAEKQAVKVEYGLL